jgi:hypothetical protein
MSGQVSMLSCDEEVTEEWIRSVLYDNAPLNFTLLTTYHFPLPAGLARLPGPARLSLLPLRPLQPS